MRFLAVFNTELTRVSRRPWVYWLRTVYITLLATILVLAWVHLTGRADSWQARPAIGYALFRSFAWLQFGLVQLLAILMLAGSISQERHNRTLPVLLSTGLSSSAILIGKLLGGLIPVFLLLAAGAPLMCLLLLFGSLSGSEVLAVSMLTLASAILAGTLALLCSACCRSVLVAAILSIVLLTVFTFIGTLPAPIRLYLHPYAAFQALMSARIDVMGVLPGVGVTLGLGMICTALAAILLRPMQFVQAVRGQLGKKAKAERAHVVRKRIAAYAAGLNPLRVRSGFHGLGIVRGRPWLYAILGAPVLAVITTRPQQAFLIPLLIMLSIIAISMHAALLFVRERERSTLPVLLSTPASGETLFFGGLQRIALGSIPVLIGPMVYFLIGYLAGHIGSFRLLILSVFTLLMYTAFIAGVAYLCGLVCRTLGRAMLMTIGVVVLIDVLLLLIELLLLQRLDPADLPFASAIYWVVFSWGATAFMPDVPLSMLLSWLFTGMVRLAILVLLLWAGMRHANRLLGRM